MATPGLYINDGGQTASALDNIIAGIANNLDPKTQAEAQLLREQTEAADRNNWLLSTRQRGVLDVPAALTAAGALPAGSSGVAGTLAGAAVPPAAATTSTVGTSDQTTGAAPGSMGAILAGQAVPPAAAAPSTAFGTRDQTATFNPYAGVVAGSYANDPSMANFGAGVNLGRNIALGPGADFPTSNAIAQAKAVPYDLTAGTTRHIPGGAPGALGGGTAGPAETVVEGGDPAQQDALKAELANAGTDSDMRANLANTARNNQNDLETARQLYRTAGAIGDDDVGAALSDETLKWLSERSGFNLTRFSKGADVRAAVGNFLKGQLGSVAQQIQGDPNSPMRGVVQQFNAYVPDPTKMSAEQFDWALNMMERGQDRLIEEGGPARAFKIPITPRPTQGPTTTRWRPFARRGTPKPGAREVEALAQVERVRALAQPRRLLPRRQRLTAESGRSIWSKISPRRGNIQAN